MTSEERQWVIQNTDAALAKFMWTVRNREALEKVLEPILKIAETRKLPALQPFAAADKLRFGETIDGVKMSPWNIEDAVALFKHFSTLVEPAHPSEIIRFSEVQKRSKDLDRIQELGVSNAEITFGQLWEALKAQGQGDDGILHTKTGWPNTAFIRDSAGVRWTIIAAWHEHSELNPWSGWEFRGWVTEHKPFGDQEWGAGPCEVFIKGSSGPTRHLPGHIVISR